MTTGGCYLCTDTWPQIKLSNGSWVSRRGEKWNSLCQWHWIFIP